MNSTVDVVNSLMVNVFNDILKLEENAIRTGMFSDLSVTEMHTLEAVGLHSIVQMNEIAKRLNITMGTLTVSIKNLVKKGYVERCQDENDRRVVLVKLSKKGRVLFRMHEKFHKEMIKKALEGLSEEESRILEKTLNNLHNFFTSAKL